MHTPDRFRSHPLASLYSLFAWPRWAEHRSRLQRASRVTIMAADASPALRSGQCEVFIKINPGRRRVCNAMIAYSARGLLATRANKPHDPSPSRTGTLRSTGVVQSRCL